ncbi:MAG: ABC transporter permease [Bacillati bacterium ANGP1]|uniref:ABC transporter permease n=1 Tax=Candidatus Segetimicrobium genomatis TaxID=2569760 RepID=A0A537J624_9BACT|nr:MAG: ABC transporter permease [Terrabacteria group bacterium ANGP1]
MINSGLLRRLVRSPSALAGVVMTGVFLATALLASWIAPYDPVAPAPELILQAPSWGHPFGTDELGRDVLSRVMYGSRISLEVGAVAVAIAMMAGTVLGLIAGFNGGLWDALIMRGTDVLLAFPGILLAIAVVATLGPSLVNVMIAVGIGAVPVYARTVRGSTLSVRQMEYVEAARAAGATTGRLLGRHVLRNIVGPIVVLATLGVGINILIAAGLSYVGLGAQPPVPEWGAMLSGARQYLRDAWWTAVFPGLAITVAVVGMNLLGDGLRDALDPRLRV